MQEAVKKNRKGFTLVELVVALAVFIVIITISFSALSRFFAMRSAQEQEMILQQNFRFVLDKMAYDFRQASSGTGSIILEPVDDNAMGEELKFNTSGGTITYNLGAGTSSGTYAICRQVDSNPAQPVTEDMHQLVKVYFVRAGGKVIMIVVGNLEYFGKERTISFSSLVFSRNSAYESSP
jgi:prepilin-type N-terminal cleavage/methylation domain-containing protein